MKDQRECFNECPLLVKSPRSIKGFLEKQHDFGRCYRKCDVVNKPVATYITIPGEKIFKQETINQTVEVCSNILKFSPRFFDENLLCLRTRICAVSVIPFCHDQVENCLNKTESLSATNETFKSTYNVYRKNVNALDILQKMERGLKTTLSSQTKFVESLEKSQRNNYVKNTLMKLQKLQEVKNSHNAILTKNSDFKINDLTLVLRNERGKNLPPFVSAIMNTDNLKINSTKTIFNMKHKNETIYDAATALLRRQIPENINEDEDDNVNEIYKKCFEIESSLGFLTNLVITVKNKIQNHQLSDIDFKNHASSVKSSNDKLFEEVRDHQETGENIELVNELFGILKDIELKPDPWNQTYNRFLTTLKAEMQDEGLCLTLSDCIYYHFRRILAFLEHSNIKNTGTFIKNYRDLNQTIYFLFNHQYYSVSETKDAANVAYNTIVMNDVVSEFCGTKPVIKNLLAGEVTVKEGEELALSVDVVNSQLENIVSWRMNDQFIQGAKTNVFEKKTTLKDRGLYSCVITNRFGTTDCGLVKVNVIPKPVFYNPFLKLINVYQKSPKHARYLLCNATDSSTIQWWFSSFSDPNKNIRVSGGEKYLSMSLEMSRKSGYYWCEVRNNGFTEYSSKIEFYLNSVALSTEQIEISLQIKSDNSRQKRSTLQSLVEKRSEVSDELSSAKIDNLRVALASAMRTQENAIQNLKYTKSSNEIANVSFLVEVNDLNAKLAQASSWDELTERLITERQKKLTELASLDQKIDSGMAITGDNGERLVFVENSLLATQSMMKCQAGFGVLDNGFICGQCRAGTQSLNNKCVACDKNKYQPDAGQHKCFSCPIHHVTDGTGSKSLRDCKSLSIKTSTTTISNPTAHTDATDSPSTVESTRRTNQPVIAGGNQAKDEENNDKVVIPAAVGGVIVFLILIIIVLCFVNRRRRSRNEKQRVEFSSQHVNPTFHIDNQGSEEGFYPRLPFQHQNSEEKTFAIPEKDVNKSSSQKRLVRENAYEYENPFESSTSSKRPKSQSVEKKDAKEKNENVYNEIPIQRGETSSRKLPPQIPPRNDLSPYATIPPEKQIVDLGKDDKQTHSRAIPNTYDFLPPNVTQRRKPPSPPIRQKSMQSRSSVPSTSANQYETIDRFPKAFSNEAYNDDDNEQYDHLKRSDNM